ncbi:uncharacterized protein BDZ99DRAFT_517114 [Mytilinidion resinicola]|uniref:Uncharacterized protein n=1 Tax=Mytilinidion resinicola TaxID=574789 RepID=A0A6A6YVH4_9PEZI|nr:uncharacterized protein BDZ99DRAFT_517114 [Mytilinidion resinicola]KAF2812801.1 hypothetical protein BDZ99DRAFT_517114 [Mytilinidion resinicola]
MAKPQRINGYSGTVVEYSHYLEQLVYQLRTQVLQLQIQVQNLHQQLDQRSAPVQCQPSPTQPSSEKWKFRIETPGEQSSKPPRKPPRKPTSEPTSEPASEPTSEPSELSKLLSLIPKDENEWSARRQLVCLSEPEDLVDAFCLLTRLSSQSCPLRTGDKPEDGASISDVLQDYGQFSIALNGRRNHAIQISNYSTVLFVNLVSIDLATGATLEAADSHMKKVLKVLQRKCEADSKYLSRLRTAALWPVQQTKELYQKGLMHRAWEIFVICGPSIHNYKSITYCSGSAEFANKVVVCKPPEIEPQAEISFDVAFLSKIILGERRSLYVESGLYGHAKDRECPRQTKENLMNVRTGPACNPTRTITHQLHLYI